MNKNYKFNLVGDIQRIIIISIIVQRPLILVLFNINKKIIISKGILIIFNAKIF